MTRKKAVLAAGAIFAALALCWAVSGCYTVNIYIGNEGGGEAETAATPAPKTPTPSAPAADTTVGWWTFDQGPAGSPATGAGAIIDRAHGLNGTPQGQPVYQTVATANGQTVGLRFNGQRQRVFVPDNPRLALTEAFTIEAFVKVNRLAPTQWNLNDIVFRGDNRPQLDPYYLAVNPSTGHLVFHIEDDSRRFSDLVTTVAIPLEQLVHVAATYDHATGCQKIYLNRKLVASTTTRVQPLGALDPTMVPGLSFGDLQDGNFFVNHSLDGTLVEVRISNVALEPSQFLAAARLAAGAGGGQVGTVTATGADTEAIYVANYGNGTVEKFAADGRGSLFAHANGAQGLAFDSAGNLYVSDWYEEEIWKITPEGKSSVFARTGMLYTYGLAVDRADNVYVALYIANKIMKFTPDGTGSVFAADLKGPVALAFDRAGSLYVANNSGNTVEKFSPDGRRSVFAESGLSGPNGLAFDRAGNLYVANGGSDTIEKFSPKGADLGVFAREGLHNPDGLAFDRAGNLYAVNWAVDPGSAEWCIEKFAPDGRASVFTRCGLDQPTFIAIQPGQAPGKQ